MTRPLIPAAIIPLPKTRDHKIQISSISPHPTNLTLARLTAASPPTLTFECSDNMPTNQNNPARLAMLLATGQNMKAVAFEQSETPKRRRAATPAQVKANRENAQKSTGPRTPRGKAASSQNGLRHGLTSHFQMMGPEDPRAYQQLVTKLHEDAKTANLFEEMLVERMAQYHWLIERAFRFQNNSINDPLFNLNQFNSLLRYQSGHERAFSRTLADYLKIKNQRLKEEDTRSAPQRQPTPEPEPTHEPAPEVLTATAQAAHASAPRTPPTPAVRASANAPIGEAKDPVENELTDCRGTRRATPSESLPASLPSTPPDRP